MRNEYRTIKTLWTLSCNDFVTRFAGSYFGIIWAFIQPMVLILLYLFVFQVAFPANPVAGDHPYVLWLISGLVPWLFFAEAVVNSTNCLLEYSYLVKKIVFPVGILPLVKIMSSLFVHLFFILFSGFVSAIMRHFSGVYLIQILYYLFCLIVLVTSIGFLTSSILPFFKDFFPIVNIFIQIGMWLTPILWDVENLQNNMLKNLMKVNPVAYIVQGYRQSFLGIDWFWEHPVYNIIFWVEIVLIGSIGIISFRKMTPHFADVL